MKFPLFFTWVLTLLGLQIHAQWVARHGLSSAEYQATFDSLTSQGYRLTWISGYTINNDPHFACFFEKKSSPLWASHHGMTSGEYQSIFDAYVSQGYRLVLVNGYTVRGVDYYVAIWDQSPSSAWVARHRLTSAQYQATFDDHVSQGYTLRHEKATSPLWVARHRLTSTEYQTAFDTYVGQGYRLLLVNGYQVNNVAYYAAIWEKSPSIPWVALHGLTNSDYQDEFDNLYFQGYKLRLVSGYDQGQSDRYAAIWDNIAMEGSDLDTIDNDINAYITAHAVPGLSLAITLDDRLVFAKGFGFANKETRRIVTPYNVFRLMSISKPITSTAVMKLVEQGRFELSSKVFGPGSLTGDKYGNQVPIVSGQRKYNPGVTDITVQNLLEHQAGWGSNADPIELLKTVSPAQAVSQIIATVPLAFPPDTSISYSNFGYLILGRLIADLGGTGDYESYVKQNILSPSGVRSLSLASDSGPLPREVTYYPLGVSDGFHIQEFDGFGGWVGSPIDLLRWSVHVDKIATKPDVLLESTEDVMWTGSSHDAHYAKGWFVHESWRGHDGLFPGSGTYFKQRYDGFGFAVVMNTNVVGDESSSILSGVVDAMISKVSAWPTYDLF